MCSICNHSRCHPRCPNYIPQRAKYYCDICGEGIYEGEEYIMNDNDEYIHYDCVTTRELVEFLGYEVQTMRGEDY